MRVRPPAAHEPAADEAPIETSPRSDLRLSVACSLDARWCSLRFGELERDAELLLRRK